VLPRRQRLRTRAEHAAVRQGRRVRRGPLTVQWVRDPAQRAAGARAALAVGRATGSAPVRSRLRRRLRHLLRPRLAQLPPDVLVLVRAGPEAAAASFAELERALHRALAPLSVRGGPPDAGPGEPA
jgi:ribonuclease P protein component